MFRRRMFMALWLRRRRGDILCDGVGGVMNRGPARGVA